MWSVNGFHAAGANPHPPHHSPHAPMPASTSRMKPPTWPRSPLPNTWFEPAPAIPHPHLHPHAHAHAHAHAHPFHPMGHPPIGQSALRSEAVRSEMTEDELIPTAIVIKNIPFAVKKEQLVQLMTDLHLPLPYAFNYHFDHGVFRGLAFANFTTPDETAVVIEHLNHFDLHGRKLRVEYKKMLPLQERERIEREKRERRGQLEEQHRPMAGAALHTQHSISSLSSQAPAASPSPVSSRNPKLDVDLNDPQTLQFYSQLLLFKDDVSREAVFFPSNLTPPQRRTVHTLAHHMGLAHVSRGTGEHRQVHIFRALPPSANTNSSPPLPGYLHAGPGGDHHRRGLNRAATTDFTEVRAADWGGYPNHHLGRQASGRLDVPGSPGLAGPSLAAQNLRGAKSFADLRSYTPSPVPSSASFPATIGLGIPRYPDGGPHGHAHAHAHHHAPPPHHHHHAPHHAHAALVTPNLTPTGTSASGSGQRDEAVLVNGLGGMSLGAGLGIGGSPARDPRHAVSFEREPAPQSFGGPIGGHRSLSLALDDGARERGPSAGPRAARGPLPERGPGFARTAAARANGHRTRGSDESSLAPPPPSVEIAVE
ncbi:MAG: hypothetical protein M1826_003357 [Phylliscum demangeonii]|nr:MAG: hypothetical protein M1826_003357 [Phylliscum demangeonii]